MVARLHLQQMRQDRDEPAMTFSARLKGQASVCQYNINCGSQLSHSDQMVRDTLIVGLADDDIRLDVLGQANQEMSLDETISGKRSAGRVHHNPATVPTAINAASSTYKRNERRRFQGRLLDRRMISQMYPCSHFGKTGHGSGRQERMSLCPAFNNTCVNCNLPHHFESICRTTKQKQKPPANQRDSVTPMFQSSCPIESQEDYLTSAVTLDHHIYDPLRDTWHKRVSAPQSTISIKVQAVPLDAQSLGIEATIHKKHHPSSCGHRLPIIPRWYAFVAIFRLEHFTPHTNLNENEGS